MHIKKKSKIIAKEYKDRMEQVNGIEIFANLFIMVYNLFAAMPFSLYK